MIWWTQDLSVLRSKARSHHKDWSKSKNAQNELLYRRSKAVYQRELRAAKCKAWEKARTNATNGDMFRVLSEFAGKTKSISLPSEVSIDGALSADAVLIAEGCARHFFPVEPPSESTHSAVESEAIAAVLSQLDDEPPPVSDWEFETAARSLNTKSAPGIDGIAADLLLFSLPLIKPYLFVILNACISMCFFPDSWKVAKVSVIGKPNKCDYTSLNSFRPISLVSNLAKFLEKIVLGRLLWLDSVNNWISTSQHGFRANHSTETAAHTLVSFIEDAFSENKVCATAFFDIKSAFDSAWHPAIIHALAKRACPNYLIKIISSFLSNRQACFSVKEHTHTSFVKLGCPQGGVLSPLLWNLLVDDLLRLTFPFPVKMIAYADDITIITSHKEASIATKNLQLVCDSVGAWLASRKLFLNAVKTVLVIFSRKLIPWDNLYVFIDHTRISPSHTASFLGFVLDSRLKWKNHIEAKSVSATRAMMAVSSCLRQSFGYDRKRLRFLYSSTVEPIFTYGCSVWASVLRTKAGIKKIRSFQQLICRMITRSFKTAPTESLIILSNMLPLDLRILEIATSRLLSHPAGEFVKSSSKLILKRLPHELKHKKSERVSTFLSTQHPPWRICLYSSSLSYASVDLFPFSLNTLRCF